MNQPVTPHPWSDAPNVAPAPVNVIGLPPIVARERFLRRFQELTA